MSEAKEQKKYQDLEGRTIAGKPAKEVVARRNERILKLFAHHGIPVKLIGEVERPAIILRDEWLLSCWAKNFNLILNDSPRYGDDVQVIKTIKLTDRINDEETAILKDYVYNFQYHKRVFRVRLKGSHDLFLAGYNFKNRREGTGRYPVFARINPKIYFTKEKAESLCAQLAEDNYNAEVI